MRQVAGPFTRKIASLALFSILLNSAVAKETIWKQRTIKVKATAYCPCSICCGAQAQGVTAIGRSAELPGLAVDPEHIPLGARLDIAEYPRNTGKWILADDTGGKVKGLHIDLRFQTHNEAVQWGSKTLLVRVWVQE